MSSPTSQTTQRSSIITSSKQHLHSRDHTILHPISMTLHIGIRTRFTFDITFPGHFPHKNVTPLQTRAVDLGGELPCLDAGKRSIWIGRVSPPFLGVAPTVWGSLGKVKAEIVMTRAANRSVKMSDYPTCSFLYLFCIQRWDGERWLDCGTIG